VPGAGSVRHGHLALRANALREGSHRRLHLGSAESLPFPDRSFDCVLSINTIHNLHRPRAVLAMREIQRLSGGLAFVQVDSYLTQSRRRSP